MSELTTIGSTPAIDLMIARSPIIDEIIDGLEEIKTDIDRDLKNIAEGIEKENEFCEELANPQLSLMSRLFLLGLNKLDKADPKKIEEISKKLKKGGYMDPFPIISISIVAYILERSIDAGFLPEETFKNIAKKAAEQYNIVQNYVKATSPLLKFINSIRMHMLRSMGFL